MQQFLGKTVATSLSRKLGTDVEVGRVDLGFLNRLIVDDVHIKDQRNKPMADAARLSVKYSLMDLPSGMFTISSAQVFGLRLQLYQDSAGAKPNFQFVIDSLASKDNKESKTPKIRVNSLIVRNGSVSFDRHDIAPTPNVLNPSHLKIDSISGHFNVKLFTSDSVNAEVRRLTLREASGPKLKRLKTAIEIGKSGIGMKQLLVELPHSSLSLQDAKVRLKEKQTKATPADSSASPFDKIADFKVQLAPSKIATKDIAFLNRRLKDIDESVELSGYFHGTSTNATADNLNILTSNGIRISGKASAKDWKSNLKWMAQADDINVPVDAVERLVELPDVVKRLGNIAFVGTAHGEGKSVSVDGDLETSIGKATIDGTIDGEKNFKANISTDGVRINLLTDNDDFGMVAGNIEAEGKLKQRLKATGQLSQMAYKGYTYKNISLDALYENDGAKGKLSVDDPNIVLRLEADANNLSKLPHATFDAAVRQFSPSALGLTDQWGKARMNADISGNVSGNSLKNINGQLSVNNFSKNTSDTIYRIPWLQLTANSAGEEQKISLASDFAFASINGRNGAYDIDAKVDDYEFIHQMFGINLNLPKPLTIKGTANEEQRTTQATFATPKFELNTDISLKKNIVGQQVASVKVKPSHLMIEDAKWNIEPAAITYFDKHLEVDNFAIRHGDQHLTIDGTASASPKDTLKVNLREIDVEYILDLVKFTAVKFSGLATGKAQIANAFAQPDAKANLTVEQFKFQDGRMGTLNANVAWNKSDKQIDIHAIANDPPVGMTFIDGYVSPARNYIDLDITARGMRTEFAESFTKAFISNFDGKADGRVRLAGPLNNINLTGQVVVNASAFVTPLNCIYRMVNDTIRLIPDEIEFRRLPIYDANNHRAWLSGGLHHKHLTRLTYDFDVEADQFLCYDFSEFGNNTFYGTVIGTGNVDIHGRPGQLTINANMTPNEGSTFVYNAANPDAIANKEFINWRGTIMEPTASTKQEQRKKEDIPTDMYLNFIINCTPAATVRLLMDNNTGDYITLNGNGTLNATYYNKGTFNLFGTYTATEGTYGITIQQLIKKNFTFNNGGTIVFGGDPYMAHLNLQAVNTVSGVSLSDLGIGNSFSSNTIRVNCLMNIKGQVNSPKVDFDIELPTVNATEQQMVRSIINGEEEMNQQVLYLLGVGRFYTQGINNAQTNAQNNQTSLAMQSLLSGTISSQINDVLNKVINNNNWNFGANISTGNDGWNNAEYEGILTGRLLDNRLLINGQFGYRDRTTAVGPNATNSFIGDFDIRYLLFPNGNLALKVYNQTNDRYFTRSSLTTQGIGLIMKKDFNGLGDLFRKKKKKETKQ